MSVPNQVKVGPLTYRVSTSREDWKALAAEEMTGDTIDSWGYTHHTSGTILLHPDMHPDLQRLTLLHEILHAAAFAGGQLHNRKRTEESWVVMAAAPLLDALSHTKGLATYLSDQP